MFGLDQYLLVEWLSAWLVLNWGAHLALSQGAAEGNTDGPAGRQFPRLSDQFTYVLHSLAIAWLIQWWAHLGLSCDASVHRRHASFYI